MEMQEKSELTKPSGVMGAGGEEQGTETEQRQSRMQELAKVPYFAEGVAAKHQHGVLYQGEFETPSDGTAIAVRLHAQALEATGIPVLLRSFSGVVVSPEGIAEPVYAAGMPAEVQKEVGHLLTTEIAQTRPVIKHVVLRSAEHCRQILMPRGAIPFGEQTLEAQVAMRDAVYRNTIVYSVWERDRIDPGIAQHLARVKQCWVPCEQNRSMLVKSGVPEANVHVVPHPYRDDDPLQRLTKRPANLHNGWKRYYSIGRWEPRKGFDQLVQAFLLAHRPDDRATLTIKWSGGGQWPGYVNVDQLIPELLRTYGVAERDWTTSNIRRHVTLVGGRVSESMILKLHAENNIYVSASHGEAWGLPAFAAKLAGNGLVYVPWGGVVDFASSGDTEVTWTPGPVHPSYNWEHGAQWASYETRDLTTALEASRVPVTFQPPYYLATQFSMAAVGKKMRDLVDAAIAR